MSCCKSRVALGRRVALELPWATLCTTCSANLTQCKQMQQFLHHTNERKKLAFLAKTFCIMTINAETGKPNTGTAKRLRGTSSKGFFPLKTHCDRCFCRGGSFGRCSPLMFCDECRPRVSRDQQVLAVMLRFRAEIKFRDDSQFKPINSSEV